MAHSAVGRTVRNTAAILALAVAAAAPVQAAGPAVTDALKEAGVAALPEFLDAATESITIRLPKALGGGTARFGGTIDAEALAEKKFVFRTSDEHRLSWNNAFGLSFLDLKQVGLELTIARGEFAVAMDGLLGGPFANRGKPRHVVIDLAVEDRKLTDFTLSLPDTRLSLHAVPEFKNIPGAATFALASPTISLDAIGGKVSFRGETVDAVLFHDRGTKEWNLGLRFEKPLTLATLTGHKRGFLQHVGLPRMRMIASTKGVKAAYAALPLAARQFFANGGDLPDGDLELAEGVNVIARFDPALAPADVKRALAKLGLGNATLDVDGTVEGMFGGEPAVELTVDIDAPANHGFRFLKARNAKAEFFVKLTKDEEAMGFRTAVEMSQGQGRAPLEFDVDFEISEQNAQVELRAAGGMKGDWHDAAGIKGMVLENPFMTVGITETGSFDMLIDGTVLVGREKVRAAADLVLSPEALGLPTAIAFAGTLNRLAFDDLAAHAARHARLKGGGFKRVDAEFRGVVFAFMTPGARLPSDLQEELEIEGAGMALKASLWLHDRELGAAKGFASTEGVKIGGTISPFRLGPLDLKEAALAIQAGPAIDPKFAMSGDIALFKGFEEKYALDVEPNNFSLSMDTRFGGAFDAALQASSKGAGFSPSNDFGFEATLAAKYGAVFRDLVQEALKGLKKADHEIAKAESDVRAAERKVAGLKSEIAREKENAKRAYDAASGKIRDAEQKVDKLRKTINYNKKKAHDLDRAARDDAKHLRFGKSAKEGTEEAGVKSAIVAEEASLKTAEWALEAARKTVKVVPVDAAPKVVALAAELGTAEAGLKTAQGALEAAHGINKGVEVAVTAVGKGVTALRINRLGAAGSIRGIVSGGREGTKPVLIIDVDIHNHRHVYRESIDSVRNEFKNLAREVAKEVAREVLKAFSKA